MHQEAFQSGKNKEANIIGDSYDTVGETLLKILNVGKSMFWKL
jgi:hypothetical protein